MQGVIDSERVKALEAVQEAVPDEDPRRVLALLASGFQIRRRTSEMPGRWLPSRSSWPRQPATPRRSRTRS